MISYVRGLTSVCSWDFCNGRHSTSASISFIWNCFSTPFQTFHTFLLSPSLGLKVNLTACRFPKILMVHFSICCTSIHADYILYKLQRTDDWLCACCFHHTSLIPASSLSLPWKSQFVPCMPLFISSLAAGEAEAWLDLAPPVVPGQWPKNV